MNFILLQSQDLFSQYMSSNQIAVVALVAILIYVGYQMAKGYGWV